MYAINSICYQECIIVHIIKRVPLVLVLSVFAYSSVLDIAGTYCMLLNLAGENISGKKSKKSYH